jgi:hypothetical protein
LKKVAYHTNFYIKFIIIISLSAHNIWGQNVGIGTGSPSEKLEVLGNIKISGEVKPSGQGGQFGQTLMSNGNGTMQWTTMNSSGESSGSGLWGDCNMNIEAYNPVGDRYGMDNDYFGADVDIDADYAVISSYLDDTLSLTNSGKVNIFKRDIAAQDWKYHSTIFNQSPESNDEFGVDVSIKYDYIAVGCFKDSENGITLGGSVSLYKKDAQGNFVFQTKILNQNANHFDLFGKGVSITDSFLIVGAQGDDEGTGIFDNGSASIYKRNANDQWIFETKLLNFVYATGDYFGYSVDIDKNYAIVGCYGDDEGPNVEVDAGSASIYKRNASGQWLLQSKFINTDLLPSDNFGYSVAISGDYAIVGAPNDDELGYSNAGSVSIFRKNENDVWELQMKITNTDPGIGENFGGEVNINGEYAIIGAVGDKPPNTSIAAGSVTIYKRYGTIWRFLQKFYDPNFTNNQAFGSDVSVDGSTKRFIIGSRGIQSNTGLAFFGKIK